MSYRVSGAGDAVVGCLVGRSMKMLRCKSPWILKSRFRLPVLW